ncbi:hypothetical protein KJ969_04940 [Patescibacteria group bacterium]|nr:hypothetical protein [Patescibacteria group bacterium]MBU1921885.1 hypothetical protein [Patescibacteria group bacterium]
MKKALTILHVLYIIGIIEALAAAVACLIMYDQGSPASTLMAMLTLPGLLLAGISYKVHGILRKRRVREEEKKEERLMRLRNTR